MLCNYNSPSLTMRRVSACVAFLKDHHHHPPQRRQGGKRTGGGVGGLVKRVCPDLYFCYHFLFSCCFID